MIRTCAAPCFNRTISLPSCTLFYCLGTRHLDSAADAQLYRCPAPRIVENSYAGFNCFVLEVCSGGSYSGVLRYRANKLICFLDAQKKSFKLSKDIVFPVPYRKKISINKRQNIAFVNMHLRTFKEKKSKPEGEKLLKSEICKHFVHISTATPKI